MIIDEEKILKDNGSVHLIFDASRKENIRGLELKIVFIA